MGAERVVAGRHGRVAVAEQVGGDPGVVRRDRRQGGFEPCLGSRSMARSTYPDEKSISGSATTVGSPLWGVATAYPSSSMWLSSRQMYSEVSSHLSVHDAFV